MNHVFEEIKKINEYDSEYWSACQLAKVLEYRDYRNFLVAIYKAMEACKNSGFEISDHIGSGAMRKVDLSRYACYLNSPKCRPVQGSSCVVANVFRIQTRRQEASDEFQQLSEDDRRLRLREKMKTHSVRLANAAKDAGVQEGLDYAVFQNHGYMGLYGGLDAKAIHSHKGLGKNDKILDHMGSTKLAANLFRATQAEEKLRGEKVNGKFAANKTHYEVGVKVRKTISELGGTMPEDLPTPDKSIKQLESFKSQQN